MFIAPSLRTTTALALLAMSAPVMAEVTPAQVWDDMEAYLTGFGYQVSGTETQDGSSLNVADMIVTVPVPDAEGGVDIEIGSMRLTDNGDGTVSIVMPERIPMTIDVTAEDDAAFKATIDMTHQGLDIRVSGEPSNLVYDYNAAQMGISLAELMVDGEPVPSDVMRFLMTMSGMNGQATVATDGLRRIAQTLNADAVTYEMSFTDPEQGGSGQFAGSLSSLVSESTATLPETFDPEDMAANFAAGFGVTGTSAYQNGNLRFTVTDQGMTTQGATSTRQTSFSVTMNGDTMAYGGEAQGFSFSMEGGEVPFPVTIAAETMGANFAMPINQETAGDFELGVKLVDLALPDMLWMMGDPAGLLPRDPATVTFALTGKAKPLADIFDPEAMAQFGEDEIPAEVESLKLSDLRVSVAGAELTGAGDFTFDNTDKQTFEGMPRPQGSINLRLTGSNALIDKLIQMGVVRQEDAMGARMMMGMFTVPAGEDVMTSTIEVNEQGQVLANGQRIR